MKVLFVDEKDWVKKVPYTTHYLAEHLVKRGHQVYAIDFDDTWTKERFFDLLSARRRRSVAKVYQSCPVEVVSPAFVKIPALSRLSTLITHPCEIAALLRRESIDCIVTYAITNALETLVLGRILGVPVLFHSIDMLGPLIRFRILKKPAAIIETLLIRHCDAVLALTPALGERAAGLGAKQVTIIPNGVDTERFSPNLGCHDQLRAELGLQTEKVILFVGTLTKHVGLDQFFVHFARMPRDEVKLVIVGDDIVTAGREKQRLQSICRELDLETDVLFTGLQPAERVPLYINLADVCISPFPPSTFSKYNITMKVFEYMACGKPAVAFHLEGTQSLVPPGAGGLVYVETYDEMCSVIHRLLHRDQQRTALGLAGRQFVEGRFSWDHVAQDLEEVLSRLAAPR